MEKISSVEGNIPEEFALSVDELNELKGTSNDLYDQMTNCFMVGFYNGVKSEPTKRHFLEIEDSLNQLEEIYTIINYVQDGIIYSPGALDKNQFEICMYFIMKILRDSTSKLNRLLGYVHD